VLPADKLVISPASLMTPIDRQRLRYHKPALLLMLAA
jgi:hypothetical protein